jgi:hypothetical protein
VYYARHYARRMAAESVVDAITTATGVPMGFPAPYPYERAIQFPAPEYPALFHPQTPTSDLRLRSFLNSFGRGDRMSVPRSSAGSVVQVLRMMNDPFVTTRTLATNGSNVQRLLAMTDDPGTIAEELYLATLSRRPTAAERAQAIDILRNGDLTRNAEDLQFALLNRIEFLYN